MFCRLWLSMQDRHRPARHGHRVDDLGVGGEPLHPREGARRRGAKDAAKEVRGEERHRHALPVGWHPGTPFNTKLVMLTFLIEFL